MLETRISFIEQIEGGIIRVEIKPNIELQPEDLDENAEAYGKILQGKKGLFLIVFHDFGKSSPESRQKFGDKKRGEIKKAEALVVRELSHRMESNFYVNRLKPAHPVGIFDNEEDAIAWLKKQKV